MRFLVPFLLSLVVVPGCAQFHDGRVLFEQEGCRTCHSFQGSGGSMGPDLTAVRNRRNEEWILAYLENPRQLNPAARMPAYAHLSLGQKKALIAFLDQE